MAVLTASSAFDIKNISYINEDYETYNATASGPLTFTVTDEGFIEYELTGDAGNPLALDPLGGFTGTLTDLSASIAGSAYYSITGVSFDMALDHFETGYFIQGETLFGIEAEIAAMLNGNDTLTGSTSADRLAGFFGNDVISGKGGNDFLEGWKGNDKLNGGSGNDVLIGGGGGDILSGGKGNDTLTGDGGVDSFKFVAMDGVDTVTDFEAGIDKIRIVAGNFGLVVGAPVTFTSGAGLPAATGTDAQFLYDTSTGELYFDQDGTDGAFAATQIATLTGNPALAASDFRVVAA